MKLINLSQQTTLGDDCKIAFSFFDRALGLLSKKNPSGLIFFTRWGIHTFFMTHPIDVLVLDSKWQVVKIKQHLSPNRFFCYPPTYFTVIELSPGSISASCTTLGDKIFFA